MCEGVVFLTVVFQNEAKLRRELLSVMQQQHTEQLIKEREQWREEEAQRMEDEVMKEKEKLLKVA